MNNKVVALNIIKKLKENNYQAYLVGGCVRDTLLGYDVYDYDVTTNATPEEVKQVFKDKNIVSCGNTFLVSLVDNIEVATYRTDLKDHAEKANTIEEDLIRRDFTINGLVMDDKNNVLDIVGGKEDLINRTLRFIGNPESRIEEDPVRILRGIRFMSKYNLEADYDTHFAIYKLRHLIDEIPKERIQKEIIKAFNSKGAYKFVRLLDEYEILEKVFPSLYNLKGIKGGKHHNEEVFTHCINALKAVDTDNISYRLKLACLYHDVGKKDAMQLSKIDNNPSFYEHQKYSEVLAKNDLLNLKFSNDDIKYISGLCGLHMFHILDIEKSKVLPKRIKKLMVELTDKNLTIKDFLYVRYADNHANMKKVKPFRDIKNQYKQILKIINTKPPFCIKDLDINGKDLINLGMKQGVEIGKTLKNLFNLVINEEVENKKEVLIDIVKKCIIP